MSNEQMSRDFSLESDVSILAAACFAYFVHLRALASERESLSVFTSVSLSLSNNLRKSFKSSLIFSRHLN